MDILKDAETIATILNDYNDSPLGKKINITMSSESYEEMNDILMTQITNGVVVYSSNSSDDNYRSLQIYGIKFNFKIV